MHGREVAVVIQQSFTCDICGVSKKEANHWFLAFEDKGTLKLSAWTMLSRKRRMKHLCGQGCVHRFIDDFLARHAALEVSPAAPEEAAENVPGDQTEEPEIELAVR
jgi:hypothetical protein